MEYLLKFVSENSGDHYLNEIGAILIPVAVLLFAFVYVTRFFIFKTGFKLSNIR